MKTRTVITVLALMGLLLITCKKKSTDPEDLSINGDSEIEMVYIEGGTFQMGSNDGEPDEKPVQTVTLTSFSISKYEITNLQYAAFLNATGVSLDGNLSGTEYIHMDALVCQIKYIGDQFMVESGKENYPVIEVTWYGAKAFCEWADGRLPTEAEWEFAARGGNQSQGYIYSGSNDPNDVAWYNSNSGGSTHPVGQKQANELGIYDMSGNVFEWCNDWYGSYSSGSQTNPTGPPGDSSRVFRGGNWGFGTKSCRVADRDYHYPSISASGVGFRLCRI